MNKDNNKTPFVLPLETDKKIRQYAENWKNSKDREEKTNITVAIKKEFGKDSIEYEYFQKYKKSKKENTVSRKTPTFTSPEGIDRNIFGEMIAEYLKTYLYTRNEYDETQGIFFVDKNYNLPTYFWVRMNQGILPRWEKDGVPAQRAWTLAVTTIKKNEKDFINMLKSWNFNDLNHLSNCIIKFISDRILTTYRDIIKQAQQNLIQKKKEEQANNIVNIDNDNLNKLKNRSQLKKKKNIKFDTNGRI